jgi:hypothetical protein
MKYLFLKGVLALSFIVLGIVKGNPLPEKKLNLQLTLPQAQMILQALSECDCPQKTAAETRQYIVSEYNLQFPQPKPADTTKPKKP